MSSPWYRLDELAAALPVARIEWAAEMPSTNDRALALAQDAGCPTPLLVLTDRQSAGRGRGLNRWWSSDGALTFSVVIDVPERVPAEHRSRASLLVALAVRSVLAEHVLNGAISVKWPNDVFLAGRKVCGVLIEATAGRAGRMVIGVGVNVNNTFVAAPDTLARTATSLFDYSGQRFDPTTVLAELVRRLVFELASFAVAQGMIERWQPHCFLTGRSVQIEVGGRRIAGVCRGIDEAGGLLLATDSGVRSFLSGTIVSYDERSN